jgi:hypothetical protein
MCDCEPFQSCSECRLNEPLKKNFGCSSTCCKLSRDKTGQKTNGPCDCLKPLTTANRIFVEKQLKRIEELESAINKFLSTPSNAEEMSRMFWKNKFKQLLKKGEDEN